MSIETGSWAAAPTRSSTLESGFGFAPDAGYNSTVGSGFAPEAGFGSSAGFDVPASESLIASEKGAGFAPDFGHSATGDFDSDAGFGPSGFDLTRSQGFEVTQALEKRESRFGDSIKNLAHRATEGIVAFKPQLGMSIIGENIPTDITLAGAGDKVRGVFENVRADAQSTWDNRGDVLQAGGNYAVNAGLEVGKQGLGAALEVIKKDTGISIEKDYDGVNKLKIRKAKLAKFALKAVLTGGGSVANTGRKAAVAGVGGVRTGAVSQVQAARSQAIQSAKSYALGQFTS